MVVAILVFLILIYLITTNSIIQKAVKKQLDKRRAKLSETGIDDDEVSTLIFIE